MYHFVTTYFHLIYFHLLLPAKGERKKSRADGTATLSEPEKKEENNGKKSKSRRNCAIYTVGQ